jgi:hypothetical protein
LLLQTLAITAEPNIKISTQNTGSTFWGINDTVPKAIINPKIDN